MNEVAIVTAADAGYFPLLKGLVASIQDKPESEACGLFVFDVGLDDQQKTWLRVRGVKVVDVDWPYAPHVAARFPRYFRAFLARCRIPDLIPGFGVYVWLDADAWVQSWGAVEHLVATALERGFAVVAESDPAYPADEELRDIHRRSCRLFAQFFPAEDGHNVRPINVGCFAGRASSPLWRLWKQVIDQNFMRHVEHAKMFLFDQSALTIAVSQAPNAAQFLDATHNWCCHLARPWVATDGHRLLHPAPPHRELGIVHLTASTKKEWLRLTRIDGGQVSRLVAYESPSTMPLGDYVSPNFAAIRPDATFPNLRPGDRDTCDWPYLRREIPHLWYVDRRMPTQGVLNRDEAHLLYNMALRLPGRPALATGSQWGWVACHIVAAGMSLDIVDPMLADPDARSTLRDALRTMQPGEIRLNANRAPYMVGELAKARPQGWSLFFINGGPERTSALDDVVACEPFAARDAAMIFHNLASPHVGAAVRHLAGRGWSVRIQHTMQIMAIASRGNIRPPVHRPDPRISWRIPEHLADIA
jgi:hypothetical protein